MQRSPLTFRNTTYNEGLFYTPVPVARKLVAPGDSITSLIVDARMISAVFNRVVTTPVLAQMWAFYVPHRLVFDQWQDFIALDDVVLNVPNTTVAWPLMFENGGVVARSALFRRSYKLIYNSYFGSELTGQAAGAWYDNVNLDTETAVMRLLTWDQYLSGARPTAGYNQLTFQAAVSGGNAAIPLDDFARLSRDNRARRRQKMTGDKYVDTMRLMGVELDWKVQLVPEFLGSSQQVIQLREKSSTSATDLTVRAAEFSARMSLNVTKRFSFAEHGYLVVLMGLRPSMQAANQNPPDATNFARTDFFRPDQDAIADAQGGYRSRYSQYRQGKNLVGVFQNANTFALGTATDLYPDPSTYSVSVGSGPNHYGFTADVAIKGLTQVRAGVA